MVDLTGQILAGRYRIEAFLGRGGMADVYRAADARARGRRVALKVLREDLSDDPVFLRRFRREADLLAQLRHPNIVRYHGLEGHASLVFMVVEFVDGPSLRSELARLGRPLTVGQAAAVLAPVCRALDYAHGQGILHCDVKPANILIERGGRILLADFGIARWAEAATTTFAGAGTPAYMSPEQCRGTHIVAQSDVYSLAVTLYEMLTLDRPFTGETGPSDSALGERIRWEHLSAPAPSPRAANPGIPSAVAQVILQGLAKDPAQRPQTAGELYQRLLNSGAAAGEALPWDLGETQPPARDLPTPRTSTPVAAPATAVPAQRGTPRWPLFAGLGAVAALTLGLAFAWPALKVPAGLLAPAARVAAAPTRPASAPTAVPSPVPADDSAGYRSATAAPSATARPAAGSP